MKDFTLFADTSNLILANRYNEILDSIKIKPIQEIFLEITK